MPELYEKVSAMNSGYYDLRGKIVKAERRISVLTERLEMWAQYQKYKTIYQKLGKVSPAVREQFEQRHSADLALFDAAVLPLDWELCAALLPQRDMKICAECRGLFRPGSNRAKYCPDCAPIVHRRQKAASERRRRASGVDK